MLARILSAVFLCIFVAAPAVAWDWPDPYGGPRNTGWAEDVDGPRVAPTELWRAEFDEVLSEPVVAGGAIYVCVRVKKSVWLKVLDPATGQRIAHARVEAEAGAFISAVGSTVVVTSDRGLTSFMRRKKSLKAVQRVKGVFLGPASLAKGLACAQRDDGLVIVDLKRGDVLLEHSCCLGKPVIVEDQGRTTVYSIGEDKFPHDPTHDVLPGILAVDVIGLGTRDISVGKPVLRVAPFVMARLRQVAGLMHLGGTDGTLFLAAPPHPVKTVDGSNFSSVLLSISADGLPGQSMSDVTSLGVPSFTHAGTLRWRDKMIGRDATNRLIVTGHNGSGRALVEAKDLPPGARYERPRVAGSVLLAGNWAVDLESDRVLWVLPGLDAVGPMVPVAHGVVVHVTTKGEVVCSGDGRESGVAGVAVGTGGAPSFTPPTPTFPGTGTALLLASGVRLQGEARRLESGDLEVVFEGAPLKFAPSEVAALELDGELELIGAPYALVVATREALQAEINRRLEAPFRSYAKRGLIADARTLLDEMRDRGLGDATFRELDELISRKTESTKSNREKQRAAAKKSETKARGVAVKKALATSQWLGEQGQYLEATAVLSDVEDCYSDADYPADLKDRLVEAIAPLVPPEFPWGQGRERFGSWLVWAKALAPSGARFATPDEMKGRIEKGSPWTRDTVAICTDNLLLITRNREPEVIGPCLLNGEAAVQTLDGVLNDGVGTANQRLEVRIHRSRKEYLEEDLGKRAKAPEWSAGFYNPILKASRFYVGDEDDPARQGRALHVVVAHELTHQYIAERWAPAEGREVRNPTTPGFWVVEGFARFIEDQSLEIGRLGAGLDDPTVQSVECAASLFAQERIVPVDFLVDAAQVDFLTLENKPIAEVQLTSTLRRLRITQIGAFYDEAGALTFFLMNRCGPEGRAAFLKALSDHYRSESKQNGWRDLGFKDEEALEAAFRAFLKNPAAG